MVEVRFMKLNGKLMLASKKITPFPCLYLKEVSIDMHCNCDLLKTLSYGKEDGWEWRL